MGNLRVIGGEKRGFPLASPAGEKLRPTSHRVREALFDILGEKVRNARFLDLFAGTGAVGIEALSRGAASCLFVEWQSQNVRVIRENLRRCKLEPFGEVERGDLPSCLARLEGKGPIDLVFVDPPYEARGGDLVLEKLGFGGLLRREAWVIVEHRKTTHLPLEVGFMRHRRTVRYGDTALSFFQFSKEKTSSAKRV